MHHIHHATLRVPSPAAMLKVTMKSNPLTLLSIQKYQLLSLVDQKSIERVAAALWSAMDPRQ